MNLRIARAALVLVSLAAALSGTAAGGERVVDAERGFTLTLPDGFAEYPEAVDAETVVVHAFILGDPEDDEADILLAIELLKGTIGPVPLKKEDMPAEFQGRIFTLEWQGYDVSAVSMSGSAWNVETTMFAVQIPLRRRAIQVKLIGEGAREAEMLKLLDEILANLEGETNWSRSESTTKPRYKLVPLERATDLDGSVLLGMGIGFVVLGLIGLWWVSKRGPRGAVLWTAVGAWALGFSIRDNGVREVAMISGSLSLLGFGGVILGIGDLIAKGKKKRKRGAAATAAAANVADSNVPFDAEVADVVDAEVVDAEIVNPADDDDAKTAGGEAAMDGEAADGREGD